MFVDADAQWAQLEATYKRQSKRGPGRPRSHKKGASRGDNDENEKASRHANDDSNRDVAGEDSDEGVGGSGDAAGVVLTQ